MRIDWIPWTERSTRAIYPLYRKRLFAGNTKSLTVLENEYKEFTIIVNAKPIGEKIREGEAADLCYNLLKNNM